MAADGSDSLKRRESELPPEIESTVLTEVVGESRSQPAVRRWGFVLTLYLLGIFMGAIDTGIVTPARRSSSTTSTSPTRSASGSSRSTRSRTWPASPPWGRWPTGSVASPSTWSPSCCSASALWPAGCPRTPAASRCSSAPGRSRRSAVAASSRSRPPRSAPRYCARSAACRIRIAPQDRGPPRRSHGPRDGRGSYIHPTIRS
jgi:hypothetical protein